MIGAPLPPPPPSPSPLTAPSGYTGRLVEAALAPTVGAAHGDERAVLVHRWGDGVDRGHGRNRVVVWNGFRNGSRDILDVDDADTLVGWRRRCTSSLALASRDRRCRSGRCGRRAALIPGEAERPSPGLACGGWFIPLGMFIVPFVQFRKVLRSRRQPATAVNWWQGLFVAAGVFAVAVPRRWPRAGRLVRRGVGSPSRADRRGVVRSPCCWCWRRSPRRGRCDDLDRA